MKTIIRSSNNKFFEPNINKIESINTLLSKISPHVIHLTNRFIQSYLKDNTCEILRRPLKEDLSDLPFGGVLKQIIGAHASAQAKAIINKIKKSKKAKHPKKYQIQLLNKKSFNIEDMDVNINIDSRCITLHKSNNSSFDYIAEIKFATNDIGRKKFYLPLSKTTHMQKLEDNGFEISNTVRFNSNGTITLTYKKNVQDKSGDITQAVDLGRNKVITRDDGHMSPSIEPLLEKINRKKRNSKRYKKAKTEITQFINKTVKDNISWNIIDRLFMEDLKDIKKNHKWGNKSHHWRIGLIQQKIRSCTEEYGVHITSVKAAYSSQTCSGCGHVDKRNRNKEDFLCLSCGLILDADINAAKVISSRGGAIMNPSPKIYPSTG